MESVKCLLVHIQFIYNETVHVPWYVVYRPTAEFHRDISHARAHTQTEAYAVQNHKMR